MFNKFASNILEDLSVELHLRAINSKNEDDKEFLESVANKVDYLLKKIDKKI